MAFGFFVHLYLFYSHLFYSSLHICSVYDHIDLSHCVCLFSCAAARIGKMKRRKPEDGQVCPLCSAPLAGTEEEMSRHVEQCLFKVAS